MTRNVESRRLDTPQWVRPVFLNLPASRTSDSSGLRFTFPSHSLTLCRLLVRTGPATRWILVPEDCLRTLPVLRGAWVRLPGSVHIHSHLRFPPLPVSPGPVFRPVRSGAFAMRFVEFLLSPVGFICRHLASHLHGLPSRCVEGDSGASAFFGLVTVHPVTGLPHACTPSPRWEI